MYRIRPLIQYSPLCPCMESWTDPDPGQTLLAYSVLVPTLPSSASITCLPACICTFAQTAKSSTAAITSTVHLNKRRIISLSSLSVFANVFHLHLLYAPFPQTTQGKKRRKLKTGHCSLIPSLPCARACSHTRKKKLHLHISIRAHPHHCHTSHFPLPTSHLPIAH